MTSTEYFKKRVANGLCGRCGKPNDRENKTTCLECSQKRVKEILEERKYYVDNGVCPRCHKNSLFGSEKVCLECKAHATNIIQIKRHSSQENIDKYNSYMSDYQKQKYAERKEQGICTRCGKRKISDKRYVTCEICRQKIADSRRIKANKETGNDRVAKGLCYWCGEPQKQGYKVCEKHYQMNVEKAHKVDRSCFDPFIINPRKYAEQKQKVGG